MGTGWRNFWTWFWLSLRRSGVDPRARRHALRVAGGLALAVGYLVLLLVVSPWLAGVNWAFQMGFNAFLVLIGWFGFRLVKRFRERDGELLGVSITGAAPYPASAVEPQLAVRRFLGERAEILCALILRAAAETGEAVKEGDRQELRGSMNQDLRERGLWERLEPAEAALMGTPAGGWTEPEAMGLTQWSEQLRLLRWVAGVDGALVPLSHFPTPEASLVTGIPPAGEWVGRDSWVLAAQVRAERDEARGYLVRVMAELRARGMMAEVEPERWAWLDEVRNDALGEARDLWVGAETVGRLEASDLRLLAVTVATRADYAEYLSEQMEAAAPSVFEEWLTHRDAREEAEAAEGQ